jgi:hypothetical protein
MNKAMNATTMVERLMVTTSSTSVKPHALRGELAATAFMGSSSGSR